ncbi:DNA-binding protein [Nocardia seriolae]|nr:DNA-binding protein [Nocardia seriolae]MTJ73771.1 DNA-binding protein [Nocardia seriolae]MTJ88748.1 DNA-binding protein [Nocardia seriolae]MTK32728.1 DNA-binding protein [Nocardia seriolae]MTK41351.1 DNA-binding protein [Nocardia seriolae]
MKAAARSQNSAQGTLVLDCEGLSRFVADEPAIVALIAEARRRRMEVVISALTIIEATHDKTDRARLSWLLSILRVEPAEEASAKAASRLLLETGLHGHKYAIDAVVAELAMRQPQPVVLMTSDPSDMSTLCGEAVRIIPL